ncbi:hypothetical protein Syun_000259 [Stephania yunnanensis]|uniref:Myb-like domain-containing protein n=1 Tax=Stephania yunnanensis TaxID=152371 RepID=A0AAP0LFK9_9MAGN
MDHHHHHHHHPHQQQQQQQYLHHHHQQQQQLSGSSVEGTVVVGDRVPQWSVQETREFLAVRSEYDQAFMETKRNKVLWDLISNKMKEKGFHRSADQCKCKWKNLVTRYKGSETMEVDAMRQQFPFYNELQSIFAARMQRMLWLETEGGGMKKKLGAGVRSLSSDDDEEENEDISVEEEHNQQHQKGITSSSSVRNNKKMKKSHKSNTINNASASGGGVVGSSGTNSNSNLQEILEEFMRQQMQMEVQWRESYEAREEERRVKEVEWKHRMEAIEKERLLLERCWREREEQRRMREEARAEKRDALITALLNKLRREDM